MKTKKSFKKNKNKENSQPFYDHFDIIIIIKYFMWGTKES